MGALDDAASVEILTPPGSLGSRCRRMLRRRSFTSSEAPSKLERKAAVAVPKPSAQTRSTVLPGVRTSVMNEESSNMPAARLTSSRYSPLLMPAKRMFSPERNARSTRSRVPYAGPLPLAEELKER